MKLVFFVLATMLVARAIQASEFRVVDPAATYDVQLGAFGNSPGTVVKASCSRPHHHTQGNACVLDDNPTFGLCTSMDKSFADSCYKKVLDSESTRIAIDKDLKGGLDSLTIAVKDSYKLLVTSEEFRKMVREEVQRVLGERGAAE